MARRIQTTNKRHLYGIPYMTQDMNAVITRLRETTEDETLLSSLYFSPTALTHIRRIIETGGTIITDTTLVADGIDRNLLGDKGVEIKCFIDDPQIRQIAELRGITRAEVAVDSGLSVAGLKLMVVGSAPAAINRIISRRHSEPMSDVCVLTATAGFASAVQIKEKLIDSNIACIVVRGKKGGVTTTLGVLNTILELIAEGKQRMEKSE